MPIKFPIRLGETTFIAIAVTIVAGSLTTGVYINNKMVGYGPEGDSSYLYVVMTGGAYEISLTEEFGLVEYIHLNSGLRDSISANINYLLGRDVSSRCNPSFRIINRMSIEESVCSGGRFVFWAPASELTKEAKEVLTRGRIKILKHPRLNEFIKNNPGYMELGGFLKSSFFIS